jgi:peptidoglycan/LPS O-acetylase OafA/YrhL
MPTRHLPVLDGLRAVAVLLVLWCHVPLATAGYPEWLRTAHTLVGPGGTGVELFFVLSGFLITRILIREREQQVPVRWFLLRRILRIFPIYYLLLLVMLVVQPSAEIGWAACYLMNLRELFGPVPGGPLDHLWSLCIEEHFYLLWPLVVAFSPPGRPKWILLGGVLPLAFLSAYLLCVHQPPERAMMAVQHASPVRFLSLGVGSLLAYGEPGLRAAPARYAALAAALVLPALVLHPLLLFAVLPYQFGIQAPVPIEFAPMVWLVQSCLQATVVLLLCLTASEARWSPLRLLEAAPLRAIGRISYGLYLYHLPIYHGLLHPEPILANAVLAIGASFAAATVSYFALERPILRYASRFR